MDPDANIRKTPIARRGAARAMPAKSAKQVDDPPGETGALVALIGFLIRC
jgi:hypothetical protein